MPNLYIHVYPGRNTQSSVFPCCIDTLIFGKKIFFKCPGTLCVTVIVFRLLRDTEAKRTVGK